MEDKAAAAAADQEPPAPAHVHPDAGASCAIAMRHAQWYPTAYPVRSTLWGDHERTAAVFAKDELHALTLAAARGLGESVTGSGFLPRPGADYFHYIPCSALLADPTISGARKLHAFCWLAFLACKAGVAAAEDFFSDCGLLHEWAHIEEGILYPAGAPKTQELREYIIGRVRELEAHVPGLDCR